MKSFARLLCSAILALSVSLGLLSAPAYAQTRVTLVGFDGKPVGVSQATALYANSVPAPLAIVSTPQSALGNIFTIDTTGYDFVAFQLTGTWAGTVSFEESDDNITYAAAQVISGANVLQSTVTAPGIFLRPAAHRYFRARVSTYTSGTFDAVGYLRSGPSQVNGGIQLSNLPALTAGTAVIGNEIRASIFNDSVANLAISGTFTGTSRDLGATATSVTYNYFNATVRSDQAGTLNIDASNDGTTWISGYVTAPVVAATTLQLRTVVTHRYYRVRLVNGATATTSLFINSSFTAN